VYNGVADANQPLTPLGAAAINGHLPCVLALLAGGALPRQSSIASASGAVGGPASAAAVSHWLSVYGDVVVASPSRLAERGGHVAVVDALENVGTVTPAPAAASPAPSPAPARDSQVCIHAPHTGALPLCRQALALRASLLVRCRPAARSPCVCPQWLATVRHSHCPPPHFPCAPMCARPGGAGGHGDCTDGQCRQ
jgi:hypothetical protein